MGTLRNHSGNWFKFYDVKYFIQSKEVGYCDHHRCNHSLIKIDSSVVLSVLQVVLNMVLNLVFKTEDNGKFFLDSRCRKRNWNIFMSQKVQFFSHITND